MQTTKHEWIPAPDAWEAFIQEHPELGYRAGMWRFHNFLRQHKGALVAYDAIRLAKRRFWIAHRTRFVDRAFDCATGALKSAEPDEVPQDSPRRVASQKAAKQRALVYEAARKWVCSEWEKQCGEYLGKKLPFARHHACFIRGKFDNAVGDPLRVTETTICGWLRDHERNAAQQIA